MRAILLLMSCYFQVNSFCQSDPQEILLKCQNYYSTKKSGRIEISAIYKNFLKTDTNRFTQDFLYATSSDLSKIGKLFYRDKTGFSIYNQSTTYYIYTYNETYYIGDNSSSRHLSFLPYWEPSFFFNQYFLMAKLGNVNIEDKQDSGYYKIFFSNRKGWNSILFINKNDYAISEYSETIIHKRYGTQFKDYKLKEIAETVSPDSIMLELDKLTNSFIRTSDSDIKSGLNEHERRRSSLINTIVDRNQLVKLFSGLNIAELKGQYILLDYFYQTCLPCIKAIPDINRLRLDFDSTLLVIVGIDPIAKDKGHMESFKTRYKINYPLCDGDLAIQVKKISLPGLSVRYPTMVLINPDGKIEFILEEYSKNHFNILRNHIKKEMNKN